VQALYSAAAPNLKKAIALEAFASMRRSEVCALTYGDIKDGIAHVHRDIVRGTHGWIIKPIPKTSESDRFTRIPQQVLDLIGTGDPDQRIVPVTPDTITELFGRLRDSLGLSIRYHDLRHYYASIAAVIGVPPTYVEAFGGWRPGSSVLRSTYQNTIDTAADAYGRQMADHFDRILK
jgi:integrase